MPIDSGRYEFTKKNVDGSPQQHGVYQLEEGAEIVYIGRAMGIDVMIRTRLQAHYAGTGGVPTRNVTHYRREITERAEARERELLAEYQRLHGRLPRYNERIG